MTESLNPPQALSELLSATTTWDVLGGIGGLAAGLSLLILIYLQAKPLVNRWATARSLHATYMPVIDDLLTNEQARDVLSRRRRRHRSRRLWLYWCYRRLMTKTQNADRHRLADAFECVRSQFDGKYFPVDASAPRHLNDEEYDIIRRAAALSKKWEERIRHNQLKRIHKGVKCADDCGTRYGKRHKDHDFHGGGGIEGGWRCPSPDSCLTRATGDHYCGMCTMERRTAGTAGASQP